MKKYKYLFLVFTALAILMSDVMCATVAYVYSSMQHGTGNSAPASVAYVLGIPYAFGIAICAILAWVFYKRYRKIG